MSTEVELSLGQHEILWSLSGYADLNATIDVGESAVTCVSVTGGGCGSVTPPGVFASGFSVTGYLAEAAADICAWIDESDVTNLTIDHALYIYYLSEGWTSLAEIKYNALSPQPSRIDTSLATLDSALGIYYYSEGWTSLGNTKTGCTY
jgi:hypothetical protein